MSRGVRDIIESPRSGHQVKLTVTVDDVDRALDYIEGLGGSVVDELPLDTLQVRVPESEVGKLHRHAEIDGISVASGALRFADEGN